MPVDYCSFPRFNMYHRKIAGLNITRAKNIVAWRESKGPFVNREQLQAIKGLGPKTYQQCAGFVRIVPETSLLGPVDK